MPEQTQHCWIRNGMPLKEQSRTLPCQLSPLVCCQNRQSNPPPKGTFRPGSTSTLQPPCRPSPPPPVKSQVSAKPFQLGGDQEFPLLSNCSHQIQVFRSWKHSSRFTKAQATETMRKTLLRSSAAKGLRIQNPDADCWAGIQPPPLTG